MKKRLDQMLSSLGYGSRNEVKRLIYMGAVSVNGKRINKPDTKALHEEVCFYNESLDPSGMVIIMHKPLGLICSHDSEEGDLVYSLLPKRWQERSPKLSTIGRLDKETSGLLLITDDGALNHKLTSARQKVSKTYELTLAQELRGDEIELFSSGTLMLKGEKSPCLPAVLEILDATHARVQIIEGRYHQVRRMFAAVGNRVTHLHRSKIGNLELDGLLPGEYRLLKEDELLKCTQ